MKIHMLRPSNYLGSFEEEVANSFQIGPSFVDFAAPIEWIEVQSDDEPIVLAELRTVAEADIISYLPRRICRKLHDRLSQDPRSQKIFRALAFGACLQDMSGPLANEVERLRRSASGPIQPSQPPSDT